MDRKALYWTALMGIALIATFCLKVVENENRYVRVVHMVKSCLDLERN